MASRLLSRLRPYPRTTLALQIAAAAVIPAVPLLLWSRGARDEREKRRQEVATRVRIPSLQTVDDLLVERCQPGDVVLFERRCESCASGVLAALGCLLGKALLCAEDDGTRSVERGSFEHCGIVVPGPSAAGAPDDLCLLEATAGSGVTCRPLLTRLEMSRSRSVMLLPLACPGERRHEVFDDEDEADEKVTFTKGQVHNELVKCRDKWLADSKTQQYQSQHSTLSIMGALLYATGLYPTFPIPVSPSAWLVVAALHDCGAAMKLNEKQAQQTRVEDFTRDGRFFEKDTVRLRPGWKFLNPVALRETSVS